MGGSPKPQGRPAGQFGKLAPHREFLLEIVQAQPDITLKELAAVLAETHGVEMQLSSLHRALERAGLSYKKGLIAAECDRPALRQARHDLIMRRRPRMRLEPHRLVFIDGEEYQKTPQWGVFPTHAVKTNLTQLRGRAPFGERLYGTAPFGKWGTQTFIAGLTQDALIAPWVIKGAMNGPAFDTYIETQLAPALVPEPSSSSTTCPHARASAPPKHCAREAAGSCFCLPTAPISIRSKWPSPNSKLT